MATSVDHLQPRLLFRVLPPGQGGDLLRTPLADRRGPGSSTSSAAGARGRLAEVPSAVASGSPRRRLDMDAAATEPASPASTSTSSASITLEGIVPFYGQTPGAASTGPNPRGRGALQLGTFPSRCLPSLWWC